MSDRVRPLKLENSSGGTETDLYPSETDPSEDYIEARGFVLQNVSSKDELVKIDRSGNQMKFFDSDVPGGELLKNLINVPFGSGALTVSDNNSSTSTLSTFQTKITLTANVSTTGTYILNWHILSSTNAANKSYELQIIRMPSTVISEFNDRRTIADTEVPFSGSYPLFLTPGPQTFKIQYRRIDSVTVSVRNASLIFFQCA